MPDPPPEASARREQPGSANETLRAAEALSSEPVTRSKIGRIWIAAGVSAVFLAVVLVFILQNLQDVRIHLFTFSGNLPLGVALLLAAVLGALVVVSLGTARILQLRLAARRHGRTLRRAAGRDKR